MRSFVVVSALCGLAAAAPRPNPQTINIAAIDDLPTPSVLGLEPAAVTTPAVTYDPTVAASSVAAAISTDPPVIQLSKRDTSKRGVNDPCAPQPGGAGPVPNGGSVADYLNPSSILRQQAQQATTPSRYTLNFKDQLGSTQQIGYLTYFNIESGQYDVQQCANICDNQKYCLGFNIYYERDPSLNPDSACPNPLPITNVKCALYGYPVAALSATNTDQWRANFQIVVTGSNGYSKTGTTYPHVADFNSPTSLPAAINAPVESYNGMKLINDGPFDPSLCGAACEAQTAFDKEHLVDADGHYRPCNFFTAYILTKNDVPQGTYCAFYTQPYGVEYAVNTGYTWNSDVYKVIDAVSYQLSQQDPGQVARQSP